MPEPSNIILKNTLHLARLALGIVIIIIGLVFFIPGLINPVSSDAMINAHVWSVRTPIKGNIKTIYYREGEKLKKGDIILGIENYHVDTSNLNLLKNELNSLKNKLSLKKTRLKHIQSFQKLLKSNMSSYKKSVIKHYQALKGEALAEIVTSESQYSEAHEKFTRVNQLYSQGLISKSQYEETKSRNEVAYSKLQKARHNLDRIEVGIQSANNGVYLEGGFDNAPYSHQRNDEVFLLVNELENEIGEISLQIKSLDNQITVEEERLNRDNSIELKAPKDGYAWYNLKGQGERVTEDEQVMQIVDIDNPFLVVNVAERYFQDIKIGDKVIIKMIGSKEKFEGYVDSIKGKHAQHFIGARLAVSTPPIEHDEISVIVKFETDISGSSTSRLNQIGRRATVTFRKNNFLDNLTDKHSYF